MTYYPDLSACDYFGFIDAPLVAVGWLENGRPVPGGEVPEQVFDQLRELLREPWGRHFLAGTTVTSASTDTGRASWGTRLG
jgi:hypothetical protein